MAAGDAGGEMPITLGRLKGDGAELALAAMTDEAAKALGAEFAAIDPWASYPFPASSLSAYFSRREAAAPRFLIVTGNEIAGVVGLRYEWLRGPYLQFLGVLPKFQGRGVGAEVISWFEHSARLRGERNLWVAASDFNAAAIRFYERHGFAKAAELDGLVSDGKREILLRKLLT